MTALRKDMTRTDAPLMRSVSEISGQYDYFILDIFGVLHDGIRPFADTVNTLKALKAAGKTICLLSNTPRRAEGAMQQMEAMGISRTLYDHVVTSGETTYHNLKERPDTFHQSCGENCWFIGKTMMAETDLAGIGLNLVDGPEAASFILNSIPGTEEKDARRLKLMLDAAAAHHLPMICANPDLVVNIGDRQHECAGTYAKYYEEIGGRVMYHGKPHAPVYERCYDLLGRPPKERIVAIGDSLHTDIQGANKFGIDSIFNLVGIHWEEVQMDHQPGQADIQKIRDVLNRQPHQPSYVMSGFRW